MKFIQKKKKRLPQPLKHTTSIMLCQHQSTSRINITYHSNYIVRKINDRNQRKVYIYITERRMGWWVREAKKKEKETKKLGYTFLINSKRWKFYVPWIVIIIIIIIWYADFVLFSVVWNTISFSYWFLRPSDSHARTRADFKVCCHRLPAYDMLNTQYRIER